MPGRWRARIVVEARAGLAHRRQHAPPLGFVQHLARHHVEQPLATQGARLGPPMKLRQGRVQSGQFGHLRVAMAQSQAPQRLGIRGR